MKKPPDSSYWKSRAAQAQKIYDDDVDLAELQMQSVLKGVKDEAELALRRHSEKFGLDYSENQQFLTPAELVEHRRSFVEMSRGVTGYDTELNALSMKIQTSRQNAIVQQMEVFAAKLSDGHLRVATAAMSDTGEFAQMFSQFSVETGFETKVNWDSASPNQLIAMMQTQREENFYSDRLWANREKLVGVLNTEIAQGMIQGLSAKEMADRIAGQMGSSTSSAMRIVRTETTAISTLAESLTYAQIGITEYEYLATLDSRTSSICQGMDGHVIPLVDLDIGTNAPPLHPNCRSTTIPVVPDDEFSIPAERAARDEDGDTVYVPADMSYEDWKKEYEAGDVQGMTPRQSEMYYNFRSHGETERETQHLPFVVLPDGLDTVVSDARWEYGGKVAFDFRSFDEFVVGHLADGEIPEYRGEVGGRWIETKSGLLEDIFDPIMSSSYMTDGGFQMTDDSPKRGVRVSILETASAIDPDNAILHAVMSKYGVGRSAAARILGYDMVGDVVVNHSVLVIHEMKDDTSDTPIDSSSIDVFRESVSLRGEMSAQEITWGSDPTESQQTAILEYSRSGNLIVDYGAAEMVNALTEFVETHRLSGDHVFRRSQDIPADLKVGDSFGPDGFISMSDNIHEHLAVAVGAKDPAVIYIRTPGDVDVAGISKYQNPGLQYAGEVIATPGHEMVVTGIYQRSDGKTVVIAELKKKQRPPDTGA